MEQLPQLSVRQICDETFDPFLPDFSPFRDCKVSVPVFVDRNSLFSLPLNGFLELSFLDFFPRTRQTPHGLNEEPRLTPSRLSVFFLVMKWPDLLILFYVSDFWVTFPLSFWKTWF